MRAASLIAAAAVSVAGCLPFVGASAPQTVDVTRAPPTAEPTVHAATAACSAMLSDIPGAELRSGEATLAGAYDVSAAQLAAYKETFLEEGYPSYWRKSPNKRILMCLFDGDFETMTPAAGVSPDENLAVRVMILDDGEGPEIEGFARKDPSVMPAIDPAILEP